MSAPPQSTIDFANVEKLKKSNKSLTKQVKMIMRLFKSDDKFSQMLNQYESSPEFGNASGSGGCGDDEPAAMRTATRMRRMRRMEIMLDQFESSPEFGGASGSGGCRDDESGGDEDEEDGDS
ncbi:hypothetical protein Tco_0230216 [Tanacetum coccineum]